MSKILDASDSELGDMMDTILTQSLYFCTIVGDDEENDDERL